MDKKVYVTVGQLVNSCGLSRSTILRMEDAGLLEPAARGDGSFRYYDAENILRIMHVYNLHKLGLTRREIRAMIEDPGNYTSAIRKLEEQRERLDRVIQGLKKRTLQDNTMKTELTVYPPMPCFIRSFDARGDRYNFNPNILQTLADAVRAGCVLDNENSPFLRVRRPDLAAGEYQPGIYRYYVCIPLKSGVKQPNLKEDDCFVDEMEERTAMSVTWHGRVGSLYLPLLELVKTAKAHGLQPTGWFHAQLVLFSREEAEEVMESRVLQAALIVE